MSESAALRAELAALRERLARVEEREHHVQGSAPSAPPLDAVVATPVYPAATPFATVIQASVRGARARRRLAKGDDPRWGRGGDAKCPVSASAIVVEARPDTLVPLVEASESDDEEAGRGPGVVDEDQARPAAGSEALPIEQLRTFWALGLVILVFILSILSLLRESHFRRAELPKTRRGDAAAATWIFRGGESRRRRGYDTDQCDDAAAPAWTAQTSGTTGRLSK